MVLRFMNPSMLRCNTFTIVYKPKLTCLSVIVRLRYGGGDFVVVLVVVEGDDVAGDDLCRDNHFGERIFEIFLDGAFERTSAVLYVVALVGDIILGIVGEM